MEKVIVVIGPTSVGKTKMGVALAKKFNGEVISGDSMQIYKQMDIGTAKVTEEEKEGIPHHLLDFKEVTEEYTIYHYQKDCREKIKDIQSRNKTPILVGGTGLYIKAALYDYKLSEEKSTNTYDNLTNEELYEELKKLDKDIIIDKDNRRRLIRAINYYKENNESINLKDMMLRELLGASLLEGGMIIIPTYIRKLLPLFKLTMIVDPLKYIAYALTIGSIIYAYFQANTQSFHDKVAKTIVVKQ